MHLELPRSSTLGASTVFRLMVAAREPPNGKDRHMFVASAAQSLIL
jgi:hypothetical protein